MSNSLSVSWTYKQPPHYKEKVCFEVLGDYVTPSTDPDYDPDLADTWIREGFIHFKQMTDYSLKQERMAEGNVEFNTLHDADGEWLHELNSTRRVMFRRMHEGMNEAIQINNLYHLINSQYSAAVQDDGTEQIIYSFMALDLCGILSHRILRNNMYFPTLQVDPETGEKIYPSNYMQYYITQADELGEVMITADVIAKAIDGLRIDPATKIYNNDNSLYGTFVEPHYASPNEIFQTCGTDCGEKDVLAFLADSNWRTALFHSLKRVDSKGEVPAYKASIWCTLSEDLPLITLDYDKSNERPQLFAYNKTKDKIMSGVFVRGDSEVCAYAYNVYPYMPVPFESFSSNTDDSDPMAQAQEKLRTNQSYITYDIELAFEDKLPFVDFFVGSKIILKNIYQGIEDVVLYVRQIDETISGDERQVIIKLEEPPVF